MVKTCPHANACLTCPMFVTTAEFLPQHHAQRQATLQIITAAEAAGHARVAEMNKQVADNLGKIITALEADRHDSDSPPGSSRRCVLTPPPRSPPPQPAGTNSPASRAIQALRELDRAGAPVTFTSVASAAGISRSWLYTQPDIRDQIQQLRDTTSRTPDAAIPARQRATDASLRSPAHRRPRNATAHSPRKTPGYGASSPAPSATSAPPGRDPVTIQPP